MSTTGVNSNTNADHDQLGRLNTQDDIDAASIPGESRGTADDGQLPTVATPEENGDGGAVDISDREAAAAAAEVSVMGQASRVQRRDTAGEEAMIGATGDGVGAFEMVDEVGELVKDRFLQFLME